MYARSVSHRDIDKYQFSTNRDVFTKEDKKDLFVETKAGYDNIHANVVASDRIIIKCFNTTSGQVSPFSACGVSSIDTFIGDQHAISLSTHMPMSDVVSSKLVHQFDVSDISDFHSRSDGTKLVLKVKKNDSSATDLVARRKNRVTPYGIDLFNSDTFGFWVPLGLLGTNFEKTQNGIEFAAMPVNLGVGSQFWLTHSFYVGVSGIAGWTATSSGNEASKTATLSALSTGVLFDVSGFVYIGPSYISDFRSGHADRKWFFTLGAGPKAIEFLSGKSN